MEPHGMTFTESLTEMTTDELAEVEYRETFEGFTQMIEYVMRRTGQAREVAVKLINGNQDRLRAFARTRAPLWVVVDELIGG